MFASLKKVEIGSDQLTAACTSCAAYSLRIVRQINGAPEAPDYLKPLDLQPNLKLAPD